MANAGADKATQYDELKFWFGGNAQEVVEKHLLKPVNEAFDVAMEELKEKFGLRRNSASEMLDEVLAGEAIVTKDTQGFQHFLLRLEKVYQVALDTTRADDFDRRSLPSDILARKLPMFVQEWAKKKAKAETQKKPELKFKDFLIF